MTSRIAIIPARGGSKRIPNKNIKVFCGKPMIAYSLAAAKESGLFDVIHVSTEDTAIAEIIKGLGFQIDFMRPSELADDATGIMPVLKCVLEKYQTLGQDFDQVCMLMATAPLIDADDLRSASALHDQFDGYRAVLSVVPYLAPVEWAFNLDQDGTLIPEYPGMFSATSQELTQKYHDAGAFAFFSTQRVLESEGSGKDTDFAAYILPKYKAVDIDDMDDWETAEILHYGLRSRSLL